MNIWVNLTLNRLSFSKLQQQSFEEGSETFSSVLYADSAQINRPILSIDKKYGYNTRGPTKR